MKMVLSCDFHKAHAVRVAASICGLVILMMEGCARSEVPPEALSQYMQAEDFYVRGQVEAALAVFSRVARQYPRFAQARFMEAKSLYLADRPVEAMAALKELVRAEPRYHEAQIWLARIMVQQGETEAAEKLIAELLGLDSQDARLLHLMATVKTDSGDLEEAIAYLRKAAATEEELARVHLDLGSLYYRFGLDADARRELARALVLLPESSPLLKPVQDMLARIDGERSPE
jgi:tetratricopeptide (TPR) repeat protein